MTQVVFHTVTEQYVPLKQQKWALTWQTLNQATWKATPVGQVLSDSFAPLPNPANTIDKYLNFADGPKK